MRCTHCSYNKAVQIDPRRVSGKDTQLRAPTERASSDSSERRAASSLETEVVSIVGVFYGGQDYEAALAPDDE